MAICEGRPIRRLDFGSSNDVTGFPGVFRLGGTRTTPYWNSDESATRKGDDVTLPVGHVIGESNMASQQDEVKCIQIPLKRTSEKWRTIYLSYFT